MTRFAFTAQNSAMTASATFAEASFSCRPAAKHANGNNSILLILDATLVASIIITLISLVSVLVLGLSLIILISLLVLVLVLVCSANPPNLRITV